MRCEGLGSFAPIMQVMNKEAGPDMSVLGDLSCGDDLTCRIDVLCLGSSRCGRSSYCFASRSVFTPELPWILCCFSIVWNIPASSGKEWEDPGRKVHPRAPLGQFWGLSFC